MSIATSKMRGPQCMGTTPRRCAMVMVWDPSCWWIDGVLMLSAFFGGGEVSHGCFKVFIFVRVFLLRFGRLKETGGKLYNDES